MASSLREQAAAWLAKDPDPQTRQQLQALLDGEGDETALSQAFAARLEFGTAGLRGLMGVGPNNMNRLVVRETTAGLADFLLEARLEQGADRQRVVIAYDGRHGSHAFAHDAAGVLAAKGVDALIFDTVAPTPLCGFAVRKLGTAAGIVVTASHNPPKYNGYKVYQIGGTQINDPIDGQISAKIDLVARQTEQPTCMAFEEGVAAGRITHLGIDMFNDFSAAVLNAVPPFAAVGVDDTEKRRNFAIAYTPLHGVGAPTAERLLQQRGFSNVFTVKEQREPDGDFPTVEFPNPEEPGATDLLIALADRHNAPIAIANDPDADRLCICARDSSGKMRQLTGDHLGSLLGDALMSRALDEGESASNLAVRCTIVSSRILARVANTRSVEHRETLTGFKWLGPSAERVVQSGRRFIFAYEEALGYMVSDVVFDKDGLSGLVAIAELAYALHREGKTLWDRLEEIHRRVGLSITMQRTIKLQPGMSGDAIMKRLRQEKRSEVGGFPIVYTDDLIERPPKAEAQAEDIPKNNVLRYYIGTPGNKASTPEEIMLSQPRIIVRPSGTEPKVKIYCEILGESRAGETYEQANERSTKELTEIVDAFHAWMSPPQGENETSQSSSAKEPQAPIRNAHATARATGPSSWAKRVFRAFPLVTQDAVPVLSPSREPLPSKPVLYVAPSHPSKSSDSQRWASRDPTSLFWQVQLLLRQADFDSVHAVDDYTSPEYPGEGFTRVPLLLDTDGTVVGRKHLNRWADSVAPWPVASQSASGSPEARAFESLMQGPLLAGVLLELLLLPAPPQPNSSAPLLARQLQSSLAAERKSELATHIAALSHTSPTSRIPGWATSLHGLLGTGSAGMAGTGSVTATLDDEDEAGMGDGAAVDMSQLDHAAIRREACLAIDAASSLVNEREGKGWLMGAEPTSLDALLFAELHTLLSLPAETDNALSPRRHLESATPHLVTWTRNMWRNLVKPHGG